MTDEVDREAGTTEPVDDQQPAPVAEVVPVRDPELERLRARGYNGGYPGTRWHIRGGDSG